MPKINQFYFKCDCAETTRETGAYDQSVLF